MELEKGKCLGCGDDLEEVHDGSQGVRQWKEALDLMLIPGYGEKLDGDQMLQFSLCDDCGDAFFELFPRVMDTFLQYSFSEQPPEERMKRAWPYN